MTIVCFGHNIHALASMFYLLSGHSYFMLLFPLQSLMPLVISVSQSGRGFTMLSFMYTFYFEERVVWVELCFSCTHWPLVFHFCSRATSKSQLFSKKIPTLNTLNITGSEHLHSIFLRMQPRWAMENEAFCSNGLTNEKQTVFKYFHRYSLHLQQLSPFQST